MSYQTLLARVRMRVQHVHVCTARNGETSMEHICRRYQKTPIRHHGIVESRSEVSRISCLIVLRIFSLREKVISHRPLYPFVVRFKQRASLACCTTKCNTIFEVPRSVEAL